MPGIRRRPVIAAALLLLSGGLSTAFAASLSREERAARIHRQRNLDRRQQDLTRQGQGGIELQTSRPVPPTSPGSSLVPNR